MDEIINHNCDGLCIHQFCSKPQTHYQNIMFFGLPLALGFCKKHGNIFENNQLLGDDC